MEISIDEIPADRWRPHGVRYRFVWVQRESCRVLFDDHHGKQDHFHVDGAEQDYKFVRIEKLFDDFAALIRELGGLI